MTVSGIRLTRALLHNPKIEELLEGYKRIEVERSEILTVSGRCYL